jgi:hypothetical protein
MCVVEGAGEAFKRLVVGDLKGMVGILPSGFTGMSRKVMAM